MILRVLRWFEIAPCGLCGALHHGPESLTDHHGIALCLNCIERALRMERGEIRIWSGRPEKPIGRSTRVIQ